MKFFVKQFFLLLVILFWSKAFYAKTGGQHKLCVSENEINQNEENFMQISEGRHVFKKILKNGMTVLSRVVKTIPRVSVQIWYNVGSKDEKSGEKGVAHLIEHMIFKGTEKMSESDINATVHKLSGSCNAFTSYDFTGYKFNMPSHNWKKILPIIADCMTNASFKDEHLNSEMKAVIQELKMINDQYLRSLIYKMLTIIFDGHPYHYPLIGYKKDLWTVCGEDLRSFYKKHYLPNNATLVVAGDIDPEEVFEAAEEYFGPVPFSENYKKEEFILDKDVAAKSLRIYRDIELPKAILCFLIPGYQDKIDYLCEVIGFALFNGKSSRLHKKLVDELQIVTAISAFSWNMFEHGIFCVNYEPKRAEDIKEIESIILQEMEDIAKNGFKKEELERASKKVRMDYYEKLESIDEQATDIGRSFLAIGDEEYAFNYMNISLSEVQEGVKNLVKNFFRKTVAHRGVILPLPEEEKDQWKKLQQESDMLDTKILSARVRTGSEEDLRYANTVIAAQPKKFDFPKANTFSLSNGAKILYAQNDNTPKIDLVISLKAKGYYDDEDKPGLYNFVMNMLSEGTKNYTAEELSDAIESRGMYFNAFPGRIEMGMLSEDFEKGLEILQEILSKATFSKREMKKVREQILADIQNYWDMPMYFSGQIISEHVYSGHPYSKNIFGTEESVSKIKQKDLKNFYKKYISSYGAKIAIVGDFSGYDLPAILEKHLSHWKGTEVEDIQFPELSSLKSKKIDYYINRDQVVLCFAGLSVDRKHKDYDKLWLFDQIFGGGVLHSMNSRLMKLRERSGLFYTIGGSLKAGASEQPGMVLVKTMVSLDRLQEAEEAIKQVIDNSVKNIGEEEFEEARLAIANAIVNNFESNAKMASAFLFLDKYDLPVDYFDRRSEDLIKLTIPEVKESVKNILNSKKMLTVRIGRVGKKDNQAS